jgi:hypothetical protein
MGNSRIAAFVHCRQCILKHLEPDIEVGLVTASIVRVWCRNHDTRIVDFQLGSPMRGLTCEVCGGELNEGHSHGE